LLVKIAPDLNEAETDDVLAAVTGAGLDGLIVSNTTTRRDGLPPRAAQLPGGVSGAPLRALSTEMIRFVAHQTNGRLPIIGVGGILAPADALEKLRAGAGLVQVYTGLVYAGPGLVCAINRELLQTCAREGLPSVRDLVAQQV
jgi:dihydroorotate dehydrogenase